MLVVAASATIAVTTPSLAAADEHPITVDRTGPGWIKTEVVDPGSLAAVRKRPVSRAAAARTCTQTKSESAGGYATAEQFRSGAAPGEGPGGWVVRTCSDGSLDTAWVPAAPDGAASPQQLARRAVGRLPLPLPVPSFEPRRSSSAGPATLVAIPTSFLLDGWGPITQRTEAGGMWAVVTAEPVAATWWPGDGGAPVKCTSAGQARTDQAGTSCTHTYRRSSAAQRNNVYTGRVVVTWQVQWRGSGGLAGTLPLMERQTTFPVAVAERQTVIVAGGGDR
ncbi:hypothetical protein [Sporichthya sp.]|uniref:hypothetical protein n=1 Tax=Sporichthya sp. TaxID=65475 RepID=UPI0025EAB19C|nr:hypothetical protein [Sporichthya sp.]